MKDSTEGEAGCDSGERFFVDVEYEIVRDTGRRLDEGAGTLDEADSHPVAQSIN